MKITRKAKWITAVAVLALGVSTTGIAFASPMEHLLKSGAVNQQNAAPTGAIHETGNHNPVDRQEHQTQVKAPAAPSTKNQAVMNAGQNSNPVLAPTAKKVNTVQQGQAVKSNYGYHYGHNGPNDQMHGYNSNNYGHGNHGSVGHE